MLLISHCRENKKYETNEIELNNRKEVVLMLNFRAIHYLIVLSIWFAVSTNAQTVAEKGITEIPARLEYKIISTTKTSTFENELNTEANQGYHLIKLSRVTVPLLISGITGLVAREQNNNSSAVIYQYKLLAAARFSTFKKEFEDAVTQGFKLHSLSMSNKFIHPFNSPETIAILERPVGESKRRFEYRFLTVKGEIETQKVLNAAVAEGFQPIDMLFNQLLLQRNSDAPNAEIGTHEYRFLHQDKDSKLEKEMNKLAAEGFRFSLGSFVYDAIMSRPLRTNIQKYEYKILETARVGTMQKELEDTSRHGFTYHPNSSGFGLMVAIMERPIPENSGNRRYEYKLLAAGREETVQRELNEALAAGYRFLDLSTLGDKLIVLGREAEADKLTAVQNSQATSQLSPREALIARAKSLELNTPYVPPPGEAIEHDAAGFAKIMCSAVFITGLDPDFAAENVGCFTSPCGERRTKLGKPVIDRANKTVQVTLPSGVRRTAKYLGDQGCVTFPLGKDSVNFKPIRINERLPDPSTQTWPMGDRLASDPLPKEIDANKLKLAVDAAFEPAAGMTAAFVVTWKGRIIGERYGDGINMHTPLESWSMGKSLTATLMGILIKQGVYSLMQPAPIPEWRSEGDPRAKIRIADILHMSSGLRIRAPQDPDYDPAGPYPDHLYLYTGGVNSFHYAATRPLQWPPGTVGRYRNTDPVLINYLVRLGVEKRREEYLSFPQRALFDKIGIRTMVMETDPFGNFLTQGYEFASGRDWARLGNLYLQDGVWNGERILPEGYVKFVSTLARRGRRTGARFTAASSGSTVRAHSRCRGMLIIWPVRGGKQL